MLSDSIADMLAKKGYAACKLARKACHELASMANVSATARKEEACA
jgi:hypothetical protein